MNKDLNIIKQFESADKEEFKRPDHKDFMTSSELKAAKFNGVRHNGITNDMEMWIEGEIKFIATPSERALDPSCWEKKFQEYFGIHNIEMLKGAH